MKIIAYTAVLLAIACTGCASTPEKIKYVKVTSDSYCKADREIKWSKADTPDTINSIRRHNESYRKGC